MPGLFYELNFLGKFFLLDLVKPIRENQKKQMIDFVMRLQQSTAPLMAKGFEDTVLYVYNKLISLNEVGGDPSVFGTERRQFHIFNKDRARDSLFAMNATSTHDSKRGEDIRARIKLFLIYKVLKARRANRKHRCLVENRRYS